MNDRKSRPSSTAFTSECLMGGDSGTHMCRYRASTIIKENNESHVLSSFKQRRTLGQRVKESNNIKRQYPCKIPVIIERYGSEKNLPNLDKSKFLVPSDLQIGELSRIIRRRLQLSCSQSLFLLVNQHGIAGNTMTISQIYKTEADEDGFLYIVFASQEVFGSL